MPESRVGRNACKTSMVRLTANPRAIVPSTARLFVRTEEKYAQKKKPRGMNPAIFMPKSFQ
jgi:hypothetical protein